MNKFFNIPVPLQKQVLLRLGLSMASILLFVVLLYLTGEIHSALPCVALAVFGAGNAYLLYRTASRNEYIVICGRCESVEVTSVRRRLKAFLLETDDYAVRVIATQRQIKIRPGTVVELYVANSTTVEEKDDSFVLHQYLAINLKGGIGKHEGK